MLTEEDIEISKMEDQVLTIAGKDLLREIKLAKNIHKHAWQLLEKIDGKAALDDLKFYERFYLLLGIRSLTHLRSVIILIQKGYAAEVASLGCNLLEIFMQVKYVDEDKDRASEWFNHKNPYKAVWGIGMLFKHFDDSNLKEHYSALARIKHSQFYGTGINMTPSEKGWNLDAGPSLDDWLLRWVLTYTTTSFVDILARIRATFGKFHENYATWNKIFNKIDTEFRLSYKEMVYETKMRLDNMKKETQK